MKNGRPATRSVCVAWGTKKFRIGVLRVRSLRLDHSIDQTLTVSAAEASVHELEGRLQQRDCPQRLLKKPGCGSTQTDAHLPRRFHYLDSPVAAMEVKSPRRPVPQSIWPPKFVFFLVIQRDP